MLLDDPTRLEHALASLLVLLERGAPSAYFKGQVLTTITAVMILFDKFKQPGAGPAQLVGHLRPPSDPVPSLPSTMMNSDLVPSTPSGRHVCTPSVREKD